MEKIEIKRTITLNNESYQQIKEYCQKNGLKISWLTEKVLLDYINIKEKNEK
jgi:hypothetical protein